MLTRLAGMCIGSMVSIEHGSGDLQCFHLTGLEFLETPLVGSSLAGKAYCVFVQPTYDGRHGLGGQMGTGLQSQRDVQQRQPVRVEREDRGPPPHVRGYHGSRLRRLHCPPGVAMGAQVPGWNSDFFTHPQVGLQLRGGSDASLARDTEEASSRITLS